MLANFDETMVESPTNSKTKVVAYREKNCAITVADPGLPHITLGVTIFADGTHADHLLIYPMKTVPKENRGANSIILTGYNLSGQESGWISNEVFDGHCRQTVIPAFAARRARLEQKGMKNVIGVFLVDGHSSRMNASLMDEFQQNNILVPVLPAHASHVLQPLDLAVFGAFKAGLTKGDSAVRILSLPERRHIILQKVVTELHKALEPRIILKSWERSGLCPFDDSIPLQHPCILISSEEQPLKIDSSLNGESSRYELGGKVITDFAEIEQIRLVENRRKQSKIQKTANIQVPKDNQRSIDPLNALPSAPRKRGRPVGSTNQPK